jgi:hypothetical protein
VACWPKRGFAPKARVLPASVRERPRSAPDGVRTQRSADHPRSGARVWRVKDINNVHVVDALQGVHDGRSPCVSWPSRPPVCRPAAAPPRRSQPLPPRSGETSLSRSRARCLSTTRRCGAAWPRTVSCQLRKVVFTAPATKPRCAPACPRPPGCALQGAPPPPRHRRPAVAWARPATAARSRHSPSASAATASRSHRRTRRAAAQSSAPGESTFTAAASARRSPAAAGSCREPRMAETTSPDALPSRAASGRRAEASRKYTLDAAGRSHITPVRVYLRGGRPDREPRRRSGPGTRRQCWRAAEEGRRPRRSTSPAYAPSRWRR